LLLLVVLGKRGAASGDRRSKFLWFAAFSFFPSRRWTKFFALNLPC
jgi:hypothetical protein